MLSKWPSKRKLDEAKHAGLAHQNGNGLAFFHRMHSRALTPIDLPDNLIAPGGVLLVVSRLFAVPVLVLWVGLENIPSTGGAAVRASLPLPSYLGLYQCLPCPTFT